MPRALDSAGEATSGRAKLERELTSALTAALKKFLVGVESDALVGLNSPVRLASASEPFTLGKVLAGWSNVATAVTSTIARSLHLTPDNPHLTSVERRMMYSALPTKAFDSAKAVLLVSGDQGWSAAETARSLASVLNPFSGTVVNAVKDIGTEGTAWQADALRMARTEATAAFSYDTLNALAASPDFVGKMWVSYHDAHTRPSHSDADGQVVLVDDMFDVGGETLMYPGDEAGSPEETYNCRCSMVGSNDVPVDSPPSPIDPNADTGPLSLDLSSGQSIEPTGWTTGADVLEGTNPMFGLDDLAGINCQKCTAAFEMRQRGYDVVATVGNPGNQYKTGLYSWFKDSFTGAAENRAGLAETVSGTQRFTTIRDAILSAHPDGSRGALSVHWEQGGSHVFNWMRTGTSDVHFVDAQTNEIYAFRDAMWKSISNEHDAVITRLDDKEFLRVGNQAFKSATDMVGQLATDTKQILERLQNQLDQHERAVAQVKHQAFMRDDRYHNLRLDQNGVLTPKQIEDQAWALKQTNEALDNLDSRITTVRESIAKLNPTPKEAVKLSDLQTAILKAVNDAMPALKTQSADSLKAARETYRAYIDASSRKDLAEISLRKKEWDAALVARDKADAALAEAESYLEKLNAPGGLARIEAEKVLDAPGAPPPGMTPSSVFDPEDWFTREPGQLPNAAEASYSEQMNNTRGSFESGYDAWTAAHADVLAKNASLSEYRGLGSMAMNRYLRTGKIDPLSSETSAVLVARQEAMDELFGTIYETTTEDMVVYRGGATKLLDATEEFVRDDGFLSTTQIYEVTGGFTTGDAIVEIGIPKGTRFLYGKRDEFEMIFPRGTVFKKVNPQTLHIVGVAA